MDKVLLVVAANGGEFSTHSLTGLLALKEVPRVGFDVVAKVGVLVVNPARPASV